MCPLFPASLPPSIRGDYKMKVKNCFSALWDLCGHSETPSRAGKLNCQKDLILMLTAPLRLIDLGAVMGQGSTHPTPSISLLICQMITSY